MTLGRCTASCGHVVSCIKKSRPAAIMNLCLWQGRGRTCEVGPTHVGTSSNKCDMEIRALNLAPRRVWGEACDPHHTPCPSLNQPCLPVGAPDTTSRPPRAVVSLSASDFRYHRHHPGSAGREVVLGRELVATLHGVRADGHAREGGEEAGDHGEAERPRQPVDVEARHPRAVDADHHAKCRHRDGCTGD